MHYGILSKEEMGVGTSTLPRPLCLLRVLAKSSMLIMNMTYFHHHNLFPLLLVRPKDPDEETVTHAALRPIPDVHSIETALLLYNPLMSTHLCSHIRM